MGKIVIKLSEEKKLRELALSGLIKNSKGQPDYLFVLGLWKNKKLEGRRYVRTRLHKRSPILISGEQFRRYIEKYEPHRIGDFDFVL